MQEKAKVPAIRFAGFSDDWEQRKFESIAERVSTISNKPELPRVEYEDIISGIGQLNKDVNLKESRKSGIEFQEGDVLYGKLRPYLKNWLLPSFPGLAVGDFWVLQPQNADSSFLYRLIQSRQFDGVANQSTGTKMPRADWKLVSKTVFAIPVSIDEQRKIGSIFRHLDHLITLHQRKYLQLCNFKKSMLEKMFPKEGADVPEIRFAGFTGTWEQCKLGDVCAVSSGVMGDSMLMEGQYHLTRIETIADGVVDETRVGYSNQQPGEGYLLNAGDILYSNINSITHMGKVAKYQGNSMLYHGINLLRLRPSVLIDSDFLLYLLNTESRRNWAKTHANQAVSQASINQSLLESQEIMTCPKDEQVQIGAFFRHLDHLITLHQRKLERLQNIKKACLEKMFV